MTAIAERLDEAMRRLPPAKASSVEKLVNDVLAVVEDASSPDEERAARIRAHQEHWRKMDLLASELDWSDFERPPQLEEEIREDW